MAFQQSCSNQNESITGKWKPDKKIFFQLLIAIFERFNQIDAALTTTQTKFLSQRALSFLKARQSNALRSPKGRFRAQWEAEAIQVAAAPAAA